MINTDDIFATPYYILNVQTMTFTVAKNIEEAFLLTQDERVSHIITKKVKLAVREYAESKT